MAILLFKKSIALLSDDDKQQISDEDSTTITQGGIYSISSNFTGTITVNTSDPVKFVSSHLKNVQIESSSGANIWIENMSITNTEDKSAFKFQGSGNVLTVVGNNSFSTSGNSAVINAGDGLNVQGTGADNSKLNLTNSGNSYGAGIGSDAGETSNADIVISGITLTTKVYDGASVGSGGKGGSIGNIIIEDSTMNLNGHYNANIGSGGSNSSAGNITIVHSNITSKNVDTGIGSGYPGSSCGDIDIYNSTMDITNNFSACIGSGDGATCGDILISNSNITGKSDDGACIGTGQNNASVGDITVINGTKVKHISQNGAAIGTGLTGEVTGKIRYSNTIEVDASECYVDPADKDHPGIGRGKNGTANTEDFEEIEDDSEYNRIVTHTSDNPLWIQHGTQSGQRINVFINNMQTKALKSTFPSKSDLAQLDALSRTCW